MTTQAPELQSLTSSGEEPRKGRELDTVLSAAVMLSGISLLVFAGRNNPRLFVLFAGLEGSVALILLASVVAMLGGLRARSALLLLLPIVALQMSYLWWKAFPWQGALGIELAGTGAVGLLGTQIRAWAERLK